MGLIRTASLSLLGLTLIYTLVAAKRKERDAALEAVTHGINKFALQLYQQVKHRNENLVVSPLSLQVVLAMAFTGAGGNTAKELVNALHLPNDLDKVLLGHKELIEQLQNSKMAALKLANRIYIEKSYKIKQTFRNYAHTQFRSEVGSVDFKRNHERARQEINKWVESKTNNKIKDLLQRGTVYPSTVMVLVNSLYFQSKWKMKFSETFNMEFKALKRKKVRMMSLTDFFQYHSSRELNAQILQLPYKDRHFKMVIILPNEVNGLDEVENKLPGMDIKHLLGGQPRQVRVTLPKFKLESQLDLEDHLKKLGVKEIFDPVKANLSGIGNGLFVSAVVHKTFIELDERGTEAAAATSMALWRNVEEKNSVAQKEFTADHPFLFLLLHESSIVFIGKLVDPN